MKKLALLVLSSLFLFGCSSNQETVTQDISQPEPQQDQELVLEEDLAQEIQNQAQIKEQNDKAYDSISDGNITPSKCEEFGDETAKANCLDMYYFDLAIRQKDTSKCQKIRQESSREVCLLELIN